MRNGQGRGLLGTAILAGVLLTAALPAAAGPDLDDILKALSREEDASRRRALVPRLALCGGDAAAESLAKLVRSDVDLDVRREAARALGVVRADSALDLLVELTAFGGPRRVREAVGRALARRDGALEAVQETLADRDTSTPARCLLVGALADLGTEAAFSALFLHARSDDPALRGAAVRAVAAARGHDVLRRAAMVRLLAEARDTEKVMQVLDAFEPHAHPEMRSAFERHATSLEPSVRDAARHALLRLARPDEEDEDAKPDPDDPDARYARPEEDDPPPDEPDVPPLHRIDIVYVIDATGSAQANMETVHERILTETSLFTRVGISLRVGMVLYRGGRNRAQRLRGIEVMPLTFDMARVRQQLESIDTRGVDDRGASIAPALHEALDRTPWRWNARRVVQLLADGEVDDPETAVCTVGLHFRADTTRTRVGYLMRTRTRVPKTIDHLAQVGGTGVAERIE